MNTFSRGMLALVFLGLAPSLVAAQIATGDSRQGDVPRYTVQAGDILDVSVWPDADLSGQFPIEETGYAYLPVVGRIQAAGRDLQDIRSELRTQYAREMTMPVVTVTPMFRVSVLGAVRGPGLYRVDPTMTLVDVLSMAGGFLPDAAPDRLRIVRGERVIEVRAASALFSGAPMEGIILQSGDRVIVPEKRLQFLTWNNVWRAVEVGISVMTLLNVIE